MRQFFKQLLRFSNKGRLWVTEKGCDTEQKTASLRLKVTLKAENKKLVKFYM